MSEHELEKLLGGFAADTLTTEEKQTLYSAALQDQQLFNAIADEQALKELLADPVVRRRLLASLKQKSTSGAGGSLSWLDWFRRPAGLAAEHMGRLIGKPAAGRRPHAKNIYVSHCQTSLGKAYTYFKNSNYKGKGDMFEDGQ